MGLAGTGTDDVSFFCVARGVGARLASAWRRRRVVLEDEDDGLGGRDGCVGRKDVFGIDKGTGESAEDCSSCHNLASIRGILSFVL